MLSKLKSGSLLDAVEDDDRREILARRIETLLRALGREIGAREDPASALDDALRDVQPDEAWLTHTVITGELPDAAGVARLLRDVRLEGATSALTRALNHLDPHGPQDWSDVEVLSGEVVVDAHHTFAHPAIATGIQRVVRETVKRWKREYHPVFLDWADWYVSLRRVTPSGVDAALRGAYKHRDEIADPDGRIVVPWKCTYLVPELPAEHGRAERFHALARLSRSTIGLIGFDCVPLTAAETTAEGMAGAFTLYLSAAAEADRLAAISQTAADEYEGWRRMLGGAGLTGPDIAAVPLPVEALEPSPEALQQAEALLRVRTLPIILAVGSHEPRKNHLALLHSAEILWRQGLRFTLTFVGGNAWNSDRFNRRVEQLQHANRPVQLISRMPDELLWAAYRLAHCTVFPSLHEGFGLPVAESLACGTPVITSNFGSMREIAGSGGALLIDPRSDSDLTAALERMLTEKGLREALAWEAASIPRRTWDDYARETWSYLTTGQRPAG